MTQTQTEGANTAEISVSDLAAALKRTLEDRFGYVRVRGEISGFRGVHTSGHAYFSLKDANARLDAVCWRGTLSKLKTKPEEGLEVIATGRISTFPGKSSYQIVVEALEPAGVGALMALLEARKKQLAAEGLFDAARKKPLPFLPRVIGVVTSPTGAVIRDILHRLSERYPARVLVWPVRVQGEGSGAEVAAAIKGMNALSPAGPIPRPDVLIVARGGGSLEDLWGFNDEAVARAAAASEIPLISAVGHETDWTLIDLAADLRAPTPTAAAELCAPVRADLISRLAQLEARALAAMTRHARENRARCRAAARGLPTPRALLSLPAQRVDAAADALRATARAKLGARRLTLARLGAALERRSPFVQVARWAERTQALSAKLAFLRQARVAPGREALARAQAALAAAWKRSAERRGERLHFWSRRFESRRPQPPVALRRDLARAETALKRAFAETLARREAALAKLKQVFAAVNHHSVLARGYALVLSESRKPLTTAEAARKAQKFVIQFSDGEVAATTGAKTSRKAKAETKERQETLF